MKIFNIVFAILFLSFAAVQYNDPDPVLWIVIYTAMAVVCAIAVRGRVNKWILFALGTGYMIYLVILFPSFMVWLKSSDRSLLFDDLAKMQNIYIEETREFLGLVIALVVLLINYFLRSNRNKS